MRITLTTDEGIVLDQFSLEEDIGDLTKPLPRAELIERILAASWAATPAAPE